MAMPGLARRYTVDEVLAFPADGNRYELVDGELLVTACSVAGLPAVRAYVVHGANPAPGPRTRLRAPRTS